MGGFTLLSKSMRVRVLYHDHCFDGAASAAIFSRFIHGSFHPDAVFEYTGMAHRASQFSRTACSTATRTPSSTSSTQVTPKLTWWFDHHQSAFLTPEDARHFQAGIRPTKCTIRRSNRAPISSAPWPGRNGDSRRRIWTTWCTGQYYRWRAVSRPQNGRGTGRARHEADAGHRGLERLRYRTADHPATCSACPWGRSSSNPKSRLSISRSTSATSARSSIFVDRASESGGVITFDLTGYDLEGYNKFIPYYSIRKASTPWQSARPSFRTKISVGSNPWSPEDPRA